MSLEQAIQANTEALHQLIAVLAKQPVQMPLPMVQPMSLEEAKDLLAGSTKPEPKPEPKAEKKAKDKAEAREESPKETAPQPQAQANPSYDEVKAAVVKLTADKGRDAAVAVLGQFKVAKATELKPEQYAEFLEAVKDAQEALA